MPTISIPSNRRAFPNCTAKPKGERQVYVGDALLDAKDIMSLNMRRPFDRVRGGGAGWLWVVASFIRFWGRGVAGVAGRGSPRLARHTVTHSKTQ
jgi:hypothetical protein